MVDGERLFYEIEATLLRQIADNLTAVGLFCVVLR